MVLSSKVQSIQLSSGRADNGFRKVADSQKSGRWSDVLLKMIPERIQKAAWGLAFAALVLTASPAFGTPKYSTAISTYKIENESPGYAQPTPSEVTPEASNDTMQLQAPDAVKSLIFPSSQSLISNNLKLLYYGDNTYKAPTSARFVWDASEHIGLSMVGEYHLLDYGFDGVGTHKYTSPCGLVSGYPSFNLRFNKMELSGLIPTTNINDRYSVGMLLFMQGDSLDVFASTWFNTDDGIPSQFKLKYWDRGSRYPLILDAYTSYGSYTGKGRNAYYKHSMSNMRIQLPLLYGSSGIYPNIMFGVVDSYHSSDFGTTGFSAGQAGASLTWDRFNVGGGVLLGRGHGNGFSSDPNIGWTGFFDIDLGGLNSNVRFKAGLNYTHFGSNGMFLPIFSIEIKSRRA